MNKLKRKISKYSGFEKKKFLFVYLFIAFPVIQFAIFWLYVNFSSIMYAFQDGDGKFTWANMKWVFEALKGNDNKLAFDLFDTLKRSFILWALDFFLLFPIGILTTYVLYRRIWGHYAFRVFYIVPSLMGAVMWSQLLVYLSQGYLQGGALVRVLKPFLSESAINEGLLGTKETAFPTIVTIKCIMGLVCNNAVLTGAFSRVPDEIYESAELDGAGFWRTFISIAVPCVWSTIATLMTFALCSVFTADYYIYLLTGGARDTSTIGFLLYQMTLDRKASPDGFLGEPAAIGVFLTAITVPVVLIGRKLIDRVFANVEI
ncbi:MAG: sugar ABC transporter permease [Clostridiales bacterium]|nr:sugar ABC transporter permease [Clostridiales bacterium]